MWCAYRFTLDAKDADAVMQRDLDNAVHVFSEDIVQFFAGDGHWVASSARAHDGGLEVWYSIPREPSDNDFVELWQQRLRVHGLVAQRVTGRS